MKTKTMKKRKFSDICSESHENFKLEKIKTSPIIDLISNGGIHQGSIIQIIGEYSSGKTLLLAQMTKRFISSSKNVVYIDTDGKLNLDSELCKKLKNSEHFIYKRINHFTEVEECLDELIETKQLDIIIIDSLPGLINKGYIEGNDRISVNDFGSYHNSKPLCMFMNKYRALVNKNNLLMIFSNQYRSDIKINYSTSLKAYGPKNILSACDISISLKKISTIKKEIKVSKKKNEHIFSNYGGAGILCSMEIEKSNFCKPCSIITKFTYTNGIELGFNILHALLETKLIEQNGTFYSLKLDGDLINENGINNFIEKCEEKIDLIINNYGQLIFSYYSNLY